METTAYSSRAKRTSFLSVAGLNFAIKGIASGVQQLPRVDVSQAILLVTSVLSLVNMLERRNSFGSQVYRALEQTEQLRQHPLTQIAAVAATNSGIPALAMSAGIVQAVPNLNRALGVSPPPTPLEIANQALHVWQVWQETKDVPADFE